MSKDTHHEKPSDHKVTNHKPAQKVDGTQAGLGADLHTPHSPIDVNIKKDTHDQWKFWVEILTLFFIAAYTIIAGIQSCSMRQATDASKKSADAAEHAVFVAQSSLKSSQRSAQNTLEEMNAQTKAAKLAAKQKGSSLQISNLIFGRMSGQACKLAKSSANMSERVSSRYRLSAS